MSHPRGLPLGMETQVLTKGGWLSRVSGGLMSVRLPQVGKSELAPLQPGGVTLAWKGSIMLSFPEASF